MNSIPRCDRPLWDAPLRDRRTGNGTRRLCHYWSAPRRRVKTTPSDLKRNMNRELPPLRSPGLGTEGPARTPTRVERGLGRLVPEMLHQARDRIDGVGSHDV
jgi:hypothetical protein